MNDPGSILPYDILTSIADHIALEAQAGERTTRTTLDALSQTCKHMVPVCRRHLFSSIQLASYDSNPNRKGLLLLLHENREILSYVRRLSYCVKMLPLDYENGILELLSKDATSLRSINLLTKASNADAWNAQPDITKSLLISLIQLPTTTHLRFRSFHGFFPYDQLSLCSGLQSLELRNMADLPMHDINPITVPTPLQAPAPMSLKVADSHYAVLDILMNPTKGPNALGPIINFNSLHELDLLIRSSAQVARIGKLRLLETTEQLEKLTIRVHSLSHTLTLKSIGSSLRANTRQTLKTIVLHSEVDYMNIRPLRGLNHALQDIAGNNVLEELQVKMIVESSDGCFVYSDDFPNLDTILTEAGAFPKLRRVTIGVEWYPVTKTYSSPDFGPPDQLERDQFPQLCGSPTINFSCD